jgi:hypothetical protein
MIDESDGSSVLYDTLYDIFAPSNDTSAVPANHDTNALGMEVSGDANA